MSTGKKSYIYQHVRFGMEKYGAVYNYCIEKKNIGFFLLSIEPICLMLAQRNFKK